MERMIRVDLASKNAKGTGEQSGVVDGNPKLSVFVGNLDFGCKEEDLRVFLEGVVSSERGPPGEDASEDGGKKLATWVTRVRIVRDKETQLGKGFGYVQFAVRLASLPIGILLTSPFGQDRECVDEILAMEDTKLKFAKRKLRVQRCKTLPGNSSSSGVRAASATDSKSPVSKSRAPAIPIPIPSIPKGDPSLGGKLAHLPKDERKQIKLSDADRVARRLAKKKARNALAKEGVKTQVKDRDRVRKSIAVKKGSVPRRKESKGRVRSDKSLAKRNAKK
jgi:nucleolar protein 12